MNWICGEKSIPTVQKISKKYFESRERSVLKNFSVDIPYQGWMSTDEMIKYLLTEKNKVPIANSVLDFNVSYLTAISEAMFSLKKPIYSIGERLEADLDAGSVQEKLDIYSQAWNYLHSMDSWVSEISKLVIKNIFPIKPRDNLATKSRAFSSFSMIGVPFIGVSSPYPILSTAISMAHEACHQLMMMYQCADNLIKNSESQCYSGIRKTVRPAIMSLHGAGALVYMIEVIRVILERESGESYNYFYSLRQTYKENLRRGLFALKDVEKNYIGKLIELDLNQYCFQKPC